MKGRKRERIPSTSSSGESSSAAASSSFAEDESLSVQSEHNFPGSDETSTSDKSSDLDNPAPRRGGGGHGHKGKNLSPSSPKHASELTPVDIGEDCPRFTSIVTEDAPIKIEDLDALQYEIEHLLVEVSKRKVFLETEIDQLNSSEGKNKKSMHSHSKRLKTDEKSPKKSKDKISKQKKFATSKMPEYDFSDSPADSMTGPMGSSSNAMSSGVYPDPSVTITASGHIIKNNSPDMFWSLVNNYCAVPTDEQLKVLEDLLAIYSDKAATSQLTGQLYPSPNSTKALSERQEQEVLSPKSIGGNKKGKHPSKLSSSASTNKRGETKSTDLDRDTYGPLTRRLVSALLESSRARINLDELWDEPGKDKNDSLSVMTGPPWKNFDHSQAVDFEAECERLLSARGLLAVSPTKKDDVKSAKGSRDFSSSPVSSSCAASTASCSSSDDEVNSLSRLQRELRQVILKNEHALRRLLESGRRAQERAKLQEQLAAVEVEVRESYKRLVALKKASRNKQPMVKKDKDQAWKAIRERDNLLQKLRALK